MKHLAAILILPAIFAFKYANTGILVNHESRLNRLYYDSGVIQAHQLSVYYSTPVELTTDEEIAQFNEEQELSDTEFISKQWTKCRVLSVEQSIMQTYLKLQDCPPLPKKTSKYILAAIDSQNATNTYQAALLHLVRKRSQWPLENDPGVWPPQYPNAVMQHFDTFQPFGSYFHNGLDIRSNLYSDRFGQKGNQIAFGLEQSEYGSPVHSPADGVCVFSDEAFLMSDAQGPSLNYFFQILDKQGFVWFISHMHADYVTKKKGDVVSEGEVIGRVVRWSQSASGEHHVHMSVGRPPRNWKAQSNSSTLLGHVGWTVYDPLHFLYHGDYVNYLHPISDGQFHILNSNGYNSLGVASYKHAVEVNGTIHFALNFENQITPVNSVDLFQFTSGVKRLWWNYHDISRNETSGDIVFFEFYKLLPRLSCCNLIDQACDTRPINNVFPQFIEMDRKKVWNGVEKYYYIPSKSSRSGEVGKNSQGFDTSKLKNGKYLISVFAADYWKQTSSVHAYIVVNN